MKKWYIGNTAAEEDCYFYSKQQKKNLLFF